MQPMLNIALRAARAAGEIIVRSMDRLDSLSVNEKDSKDYVTQVDQAAEKAIVNTILKAYPDHGIQGEEGTSVTGTGEGADYLWVIDPLDGTTNYIHGIPHFAVSIACKFRGRVEHAVVRIGFENGVDDGFFSGTVDLGDVIFTVFFID